jgi:hypothetical protein
MVNWLFLNEFIVEEKLVLKKSAKFSTNAVVFWCAGKRVHADP